MLGKTTSNGKPISSPVLLACLVLIWFAVGAYPVSGEVPYKGYNYNVWRESSLSPNGYQVEKVVSGTDLGVGSFVNPQDIFVSDSELVYILDSGNSRILVADGELTKIIHSIEEFVFQDEMLNLKGAQGLFVAHDGLIYVADSANSRVLVMDHDGVVQRVFTRPESDLYPAQTKFEPVDVVVDRAGTVFILGHGVYLGAIVYDQNGVFHGFYGSNRVEPTASLLIDYFWKRILTREQRDRMARFVPVEYNAFAIDQEDFIYTVTSYSETEQDQIRKLNPRGINVLRYYRDGSRSFGDLEVGVLKGRSTPTKFIDIDVDKYGFINALDREQGRVFQYDNESNLVTVFGNLAPQQGTFRNPVSLTSLDNKVMVLDAAKRNITVFRPTEYGKVVREAITLFNGGYYEEAIEPWMEVLGKNINNELAYIGIGKALYQMGDYENAMRYARLGYDKKGYSDAFKSFRREFIREHFTLIVVALVLIVAAVRWIVRRFSKKKDKTNRGPDFTHRNLPFLIMFHPVDGYEEVKRGTVKGVGLSCLIVFGWFVIEVIRYQYTGFIFNSNRVSELNSLLILGRTTVLFLLWTAANWGLCTLTEGEGKFKEIWIASAYALMPYLLVSLIYVVLSNVLTGEEGVFLSYLNWLGLLWSAVLLLIGMGTVHRYGLKKTIISSGLTVVGVGCIIFMGLLLFSLFQQLFSFAFGLYREAMFRI